jgi:hypothetical protein
VAWGLGIKTAAPPFDQPASDEHLAQQLGIFGFTTDMTDVLAFEENTNGLLKGFCKPYGPLRIQNATHARGHRHVVFDSVVVPEIGAVRGQIVNIATVFIGCHLATPAVRVELVVAHLGCEAYAKVAAAFVRKVQIKSCTLRISLCGASRDFSHQIDGKTSLWCVQKIKIAEVSDLDPALSLFAQR